MRKIAFLSHQNAGVIEVPDFTDPLSATELRGRTLMSLVSPGTELNFGYLGTDFPAFPGYASIFRVDEVGSDIRDFSIGDIVFAAGNHAAQQRVNVREATHVPEGLAPETAVFARLAAVSMSSLNVTVIRPPSTVLITGLGPVGIMAAQVFQRSGYVVMAVDPAASRRNAAQAVGVSKVFAEINIEVMKDQFHLHVECSGHEQAVLDGSKCIAKGGEIFLVGVPWRRRTEISASELLREVFHRYVSIKSGWEWQVPYHHRDFSPNSVLGNLSAALGWLKDGQINANGLAEIYAPERAQEVYAGLATQSLKTPTAIFDWEMTK